MDVIMPEIGDAVGRLAVLIPCYNENLTIADVVEDFRAQLPTAEIYVYDNNSQDRTAELAQQAGAIVRNEPYQGKGNVVRRMFADIEADTYVLVDGDGTYDPPSVFALLQIFVRSHADMVVGNRVTEIKEAYRPGHRFGNWLLTALVGSIFGRQFKDMLSGYRVFSKRFVKSFPAMSRGFEIETELTIHSLELRMITAEVDTPYHPRPEGSVSKLSTIRDGWRILYTIVELIKEERPLQFFFVFFAIFSGSSVILGVPLIVEFMDTGLVPRFPTAILATGMMMLAFVNLICGLILETVTRGRKELKRMQYLTIPDPLAEHPEKRIPSAK